MFPMQMTLAKQHAPPDKASVIRGMVRSRTRVGTAILEYIQYPQTLFKFGMIQLQIPSISGWFACICWNVMVYGSTLVDILILYPSYEPWWATNGTLCRSSTNSGLDTDPTDEADQNRPVRGFSVRWLGQKVGWRFVYIDYVLLILMSCVGKFSIYVP